MVKQVEGTNEYLPERNFGAIERLNDIVDDLTRTVRLQKQLIRSMTTSHYNATEALLRASVEIMETADDLLEDE